MRECTDCNMCCRMFAIDDVELKKPIKVLCPHYSSEAHNCSIYAQRGKVCSNYQCFWLRNILPEWAKPNQLGILFDRLVSMGGVIYLIGYVDDLSDNIEKTVHHMNQSGLSVMIRSAAEDYKKSYVYASDQEPHPKLLELAAQGNVPSMDAYMITAKTTIAATSAYGNPPLIIG